MKRQLQFIVIVLLTATLTAPLSGEQRQWFWKGKTVEQNTALTDIPEIVAQQACPNFIFAAAMETMLRMQGVDSIDQNFWVGKINGDTTCRPVPSFEDLKKIVEGDYVAGSNRRVRLTVRYTDSFPPTTEHLILPLVQKRPVILAWKDGLFLVTGATWHETYFQTGEKLIEITRISLVDLPARGDERVKEFTREKNQSTELGGMFEVIVTPLSNDNWH